MRLNCICDFVIFAIMNLLLSKCQKHYENLPAHAINRDFLSFKNEKFHNFDIFLIFAQNIDCGYTLEPPR